MLLYFLKHLVFWHVYTASDKKTISQAKEVFSAALWTFLSPSSRSLENYPETPTLSRRTSKSGNVNMAAAAPQDLACGCWWALCNCSHALTPLCVLVYLAPEHSCVTATSAQPSTPRSMSLFHTNFRAMFYSAQQWFPLRKASYLTNFYCSPPTAQLPSNLLQHCVLLFGFHHLKRWVLSWGLLHSQTKYLRLRQWAMLT